MNSIKCKIVGDQVHLTCNNGSVMWETFIGGLNTKHNLLFVLFLILSYPGYNYLISVLTTYLGSNKVSGGYRGLNDRI